MEVKSEEYKEYLKGFRKIIEHISNNYDNFDEHSENCEICHEYIYIFIENEFDLILKEWDYDD